MPATNSLPANLVTAKSLTPALLHNCLILLRLKNLPRSLTGQQWAVIPNRPFRIFDFRMTFVSRKPLPHDVPSWVKSGELYFFTLCVQDRDTVNLTAPDRAKILMDAARHYHEHQRWFVRIFLLMPDHLHALIAFPSVDSIESCWRDWKRFTAKNAAVIWQRDFFEHRVRNGENWDQKTDYIRQNPARKGLVIEAKMWSWVFEP